MLNVVSQLVTEEFAEMSQKLEMEQGLREHAEVFAHQVVPFLFCQSVVYLGLGLALCPLLMIFLQVNV